MNDPYAESVAVVGLSLDGESTLSGRLARFPGKQTASLWLALSVPGAHFSLAEDLPLSGSPERTDVAAESVEFLLPGAECGWFLRRGRQDCRFSATAAMRGSAHAQFEPPADRGASRVGFTAEFSCSHTPVGTRGGRIEVFGAVSATIETPDRLVSFEGLGKWHEQVGDRPTFGRAFTYMSVQAPGVAVLARTGGGSHWGFVAFGDEVVPIVTFRIDAQAATRRFSLGLTDGREVSGVARVRWMDSVPIEGLRRPGALVDVECDLGRLVGQLNDWNPGEGSVAAG
jgi:hypothetical protein